MTRPGVTRRLTGTLKNEQGLAALVAVILAMIVVAIIVLNFLAQTETKQYGSTLTSTSTNAILTAEAGLRYTEKCLLQNDPACPIITAQADWLNLITGFTLPFGSGQGQFTISFTLIDSNNVMVNSVGTFGASVREISQTVTQGGVCELANSPVTACNNVNVTKNVVIFGGTPQTGFCPVPGLVDPVVYPPDPAVCPNADYPNFTNGTPAGPYQYCGWRHDDSSTITLNGPLTLWVAADFLMISGSRLVINGDVTINVAGKTSIEDTAVIEVNGSLTLQSTDNVKIMNQAVINNVGGDPADVLFLAENSITLQNDVIFKGAVIANNRVTVKNNAVFEGAMIANNNALLLHNATITFDPDAGSGTTGYGQCSP